MTASIHNLNGGGQDRPSCHSVAKRVCGQGARLQDQFKGHYAHSCEKINKVDKRSRMTHNSQKYRVAP
jgi:hypothetical protein